MHEKREGAAKFLLKILLLFKFSSNPPSSSKSSSNPQILKSRLNFLLRFLLKSLQCSGAAVRGGVQLGGVAASSMSLFSPKNMRKAVQLAELTTKKVS